jgi:hypothetical protein
LSDEVYHLENLPFNKMLLNAAPGNWHHNEWRYQLDKMSRPISEEIKKKVGLYAHRVGHDVLVRQATGEGLFSDRIRIPIRNELVEYLVNFGYSIEDYKYIPCFIEKVAKVYEESGFFNSWLFHTDDPYRYARAIIFIGNAMITGCEYYQMAHGKEIIGNAPIPDAFKEFVNGLDLSRLPPQKS